MRISKMIFLAFILIGVTLAFSSHAAPFEKVASDLMHPTKYIAKLVRGICLVTGIGLMISAFIKYGEYRRYHHVHFSLIVFLLLTGLAMIGIGFLPLPASWR